MLVSIGIDYDGWIALHRIMFTPGMLVCHVTDPSKVGTITGQVRARSPHALWEVAFSHGETKFVSAVYLKPVSTEKKSAMQLRSTVKSHDQIRPRRIDAQAGYPVGHEFAMRKGGGASPRE